jgi:hypothetical protein
MATKEFKELSQAKYYASERLSETKLELFRLDTENTELKAQLETPTEDKTALAKNRRRRTYLRARSAKLNEEREGLRVELATAMAELKRLKAQEEVPSVPTDKGE